MLSCACSYANPGPWASLEGVDFVRNNKIPGALAAAGESEHPALIPTLPRPACSTANERDSLLRRLPQRTTTGPPPARAGIDYAVMHVYIDQWLCTERGADDAGRRGFFQDWLDSHQQAAEEELQMPVVLEEFGGKLEGGRRREAYEIAYRTFLESAKRGGSGAGVQFWDLYHAAYAPADYYGGSYGNFLPAKTKEEEYVHVRCDAARCCALSAAVQNTPPAAFAQVLVLLIHAHAMLNLLFLLLRCRLLLFLITVLSFCAGANPSLQQGRGRHQRQELGNGHLHLDPSALPRCGDKQPWLVVCSRACCCSY